MDVVQKRVTVLRDHGRPLDERDQPESPAAARARPDVEAASLRAKRFGEASPKSGYTGQPGEGGNGRCISVAHDGCGRRL